MCLNVINLVARSPDIVGRLIFALNFRSILRSQQVLQRLKFLKCMGYRFLKKENWYV
ncbi:Hypothetical protein HEAR1839 [Herminiimonas arsenicoxydans]|uniref:Uncharacterized protein n=1 Tax=Herminiimonas arsenicoxydans TaxID=204773 RepID=A4G656_HERAR|nr:Hypothetical protein HEAR1839 [Herminiimonas arsenicoxydans]